MRRDLAELPAPMLLTVSQLKRKRRDLKMLEDYVALLRENPMRSRMAVNDYLMQRYHMASLSGFHSAIKRALADGDTPAALVAEYKRLQKIK